ncbi:MAG TPA: hypothetical protein VJU61_12815, partial [Polyangiaceae bacterium]|nr:hypothetical protein [Polyangiaceae bacterium]
KPVMGQRWWFTLALLAQLGCGVDAREPTVAISAVGPAENEAGPPAAGGSSGVDASTLGASGASSDLDTVEVGGACTPSGLPCAAGSCVEGVCALACDPLRPTEPRGAFAACAAAEACSAGPQGSRCRLANVMGSVGAACSSDADCGAGLFCGESGQCRQYCFDTADCVAGTCGLFREPRFTGDLEVGACSTGPCDPSHPQRPRETLSACLQGLNCRPDETGVSFCEPAGTDAYHQPCTGDSCAPGSFCGTGSFTGVCNRYCIDDTDCPDGGVCGRFATPLFAGALEVGFCGSRCDPVQPQSPEPPLTGCDVGWGCSGSDEGASYCYPAGTGTQHSLCASNADCAPGYRCGGTSDACRRYCFEDGDCESGSCSLNVPALFAGSLSVGNCAELCDPVRPQAPRPGLAVCPTDFRCQAAGASAGSYCGRAGLLRAGEACTQSSECAPGFFCSDTTNSCRQYCYVDADCESGSCAEDATPNSFAGTGTFPVFFCEP